MVERPKRAQFILYVSDMSRSVAFWRDEIGLTLLSPIGIQDFSREYWVVLDGGAFMLCLHPDLESEVGGSAFSLLVEDLEAEVALLDKKGVPHSGIQNPHPGVVFCSLQDPDGHLFFLKPLPQDAATA